MSIEIKSGDNYQNVMMVAITETGTLSGRVWNQDGYPIEGVMVNLGGTIAYTDNVGNYSFVDIPPGNYNMSFTKSGYQQVNY